MLSYASRSKSLLVSILESSIACSDWHNFGLFLVSASGA
jgi:hypothetical protein